MKITNGGKGIHQREIPGIEKLKDLPEHWHAFTNLDLALPGKGAREIDLILVIEDRLLLVDLKDWVGPVKSQDGHWFNRSRDCGRSPVGKIAENVRELAPLLKKFLSEQEKKELGLTHRLSAPWIEGVVVLTRVTDRTGIAPSEAARVFSIDPFMRMLRNRAEREAQLSASPSKHTDYTSQEWISRFRRFFNTSSGIFKAGTRRYGSYKASAGGESPSFRHKDGIFAEFDVEEEGISSSTGLLRRWDFSAAETKFQTEEGRASIAGRERAVIAWLDDRNPRCGEAVFKPRDENPDRGVNHWEVFERRRRMRRLEEFSVTELPSLTPRERIELARQVLSQMTAIHDLQAAHLDIGTHSVWMELPTTVKLSHLMAASVPSVETLGESRFQFLSTSAAPEDILGLRAEPLRKDVFLLGCVVHRILFGASPTGEPPEWIPTVDPDGSYSKLHPWFERCLDLDQARRFANATAMLAAFNAAVELVPDGKITREGLDRFRTLKSQREVFRAYPETELLQDDGRVIVWRSEIEGAKRLVKLWASTAIGDVAKEGPRILAFLERAQELSEAPINGVPKIESVHWTEDAIVLVSEYVEGETLSNWNLATSSAAFVRVEEAIEFLVKLLDLVRTLHERSVAHGDLKPDNIVITRREGTVPQPTFIDVLDFSPAGDGERLSRAYAPLAGGAFERDRFAVTKIAEEVLAPYGAEFPGAALIAKAIDECRHSSPPNGTLLPLREALERASEPQEQSESNAIYRISIIGSAIGPMLPDEGVYWVSKRDSTYFIRGMTEQLSIDLGADGSVQRSRRRELTQGEIQRAKRFEFASFPGAIVVEGVVHGMSAITDLLRILPAASSSDTSHTGFSSRTEMGEQSGEVSASIESEQDRISELISSEERAATTVDVSNLWRRSVEIESELKTEATALGDSTYRAATSRHVVPIQLVVGGIDFDNNDTVFVEREGAGERWTRIGTLDLQASTTDFLAISTWLDSSRGALIADGSRLRFQSKFENTSRERREDATQRILRGAAAASDLIHAFSPSSRMTPRRINRDLDIDAIATRYGLNDDQTSAFRSVIECRPVALLQGPPGTGKTRFIGALVHYALTSGLARNVLLASQSHEAVNNAAEAALGLFGADRDSLTLIRVGNEGAVSEALRPHHVARAERAYKDRFLATAGPRYATAANALGIEADLCEAVVYFEDVVRPIVARVAEFVRNDEGAAKINALLRTVEELFRARGIDVVLKEDDLEDIEGVADDRYFGSISGGRSKKVDQLRMVVGLSRDIIGSVSTRQRSFETFLAGTRQVVAGTCVGLGRATLGLTKTTFDLVVVDEAARCTPSELAVPIQAGKWVVLVGDHAQLEPLHPEGVVETLADELGAPLHEIQCSDFERVFASDYGKSAGATLTTQYRMLPPIGRIVSSAFYDRGLAHGRTKPFESEAILPPELARPLTWIDTDSAGSSAHQKRTQSRGQSLSNPVEADAIVALLRNWSEHEPLIEWLRARSDGSHPIGIICAYANQRDHVWKRLQAENLPDALRRSIKVDTIDSYQGKENLIVVLSLVRNNSDGPMDGGVKTIAPGFMGRKNRINVALSRAMDRLVIVGAKSRWRTGSPMGLVVEAFAAEVECGEATVIDAAELIEISARAKKLGGVKSVTKKAKEST